MARRADEIDTVDLARAAGSDIAYQRKHGLAALGDGTRIVAGGELDGRLPLEGVQIVDPRLLGVVVTDEQVLAVEGEGDLGGRGGCLQGGDLRVVGAVEHQHLVGILGNDVEAVADGVGQQVGQVTGDVDEGAALIGIAVVDQQADLRRQVDGGDRFHGQRDRQRAVLVLESSWIDAHLHRRPG